jgi:hypothetical protein
LNLPQIPAGIVDNLNYNFDQYNQHNRLGDAYLWSDSFNQEVNAWCQANICEDMYWGFQIISGDLPAHKDIGTEIKLTYLINTGGDRVLTNFYAEDKITVTDSYMIPEGRWHLLQANRYHGVHNVESTRFSVTGRVFPK